ncbi:MAG: hypothetical protein ACE5K0_02945 [Candidatus Methanofastidiosia archaeon]
MTLMESEERRLEMEDLGYELRITIPSMKTFEAFILFILLLLWSTMGVFIYIFIIGEILSKGSDTMQILIVCGIPLMYLLLLFNVM